MKAPTIHKPNIGLVEGDIMRALMEHEERIGRTLDGLRRQIRDSVLRTKAIVNEQQKTTNQNTATITSPQSRGTEVITNVFINIDSSVGGTMVLTLGNVTINYLVLPADGIEELDQVSFILRPNDPRSVIVTPASGTCKFLNLYLQGYEVGDAGGIN